MNGSGISVGGSKRLRKSLEAEVRRDFARELATAKRFWKRVFIEKRIGNEIKKRMQSVTSPHSLYISNRFLKSGQFLKFRLP